MGDYHNPPFNPNINPDNIDIQGTGSSSSSSSSDSSISENSEDYNKFADNQILNKNNFYNHQVNPPPPNYSSNLINNQYLPIHGPPDYLPNSPSKYINNPQDIIPGNPQNLAPAPQGIQPPPLDLQSPYVKMQPPPLGIQPPPFVIKPPPSGVSIPPPYLGISPPPSGIPLPPPLGMQPLPLGVSLPPPLGMQPPPLGIPPPPPHLGMQSPDLGNPQLKTGINNSIMPPAFKNNSIIPPSFNNYPKPHANSNSTGKPPNISVPPLNIIPNAPNVQYQGKFEANIGPESSIIYSPNNNNKKSGKLLNTDFQNPNYPYPGLESYENPQIAKNLKMHSNFNIPPPIGNPQLKHFNEKNHMQGDSFAKNPENDILSKREEDLKNIYAQNNYESVEDNFITRTINYVIKPSDTKKNEVIMEESQNFNLDKIEKKYEVSKTEIHEKIEISPRPIRSKSGFQQTNNENTNWGNLYFTEFINSFGSFECPKTCCEKLICKRETNLIRLQKLKKVLVWKQKNTLIEFINEKYQDVNEIDMRIFSIVDLYMICSLLENNESIVFFKRIEKFFECISSITSKSIMILSENVNLSRSQELHKIFFERTRNFIMFEIQNLGRKSFKEFSMENLNRYLTKF